MLVFLRFAILGLAAGSIIALLAVAMVVAFRGSRIVNFAEGAIAVIGAYIYYYLHIVYGLAFVWSFILGVATSGLVSVALQIIILDRFRNAPQVTKIIATLGALELIEQGLSHITSSQSLFVPSDFPLHSIVIFGTSIPEGQAYILVISVVIALFIGGIYRFTQLGRATTAVLDNRRALSATGYSASHIAALNWLISGCIAGTAGILLAPIAGLSVDTYSLLVIPTLAAAVIGRFNSFTLAVVGGLGLGVVQSEMGFYIRTPGWTDAVPFIFIIAFLAIRGTQRVSRSTATQRFPRVGSGVIRPSVVITTLLGLLIITQVINNPYWLDAIIVSAGSAIVLLSFMIVTGYSGQLSLAQFAFAGLGAWIAGKLLVDAHVTLLLAVVIGVVGVLPIGIILGLVCLRTTGANLAIATLGFAASVEALIFNNSSLTGIFGMTIGKLSLFGWDVTAIDYPARYAALAIVALGVAALLASNVRRGIAGRRLLASRANERASASLGLNVTRAKVFAFGIASMVAALGGVVLGFANTTIVFSEFSTLPSIEAVAQSIVGGVGWIGGALVGSTAQPGGLLSQALDGWAGSTYSGYIPFIAAILLLVVLITQPDGAAPVMAQQFRALKRLLKVGSRNHGTTQEIDLTLSTGSDEISRVPSKTLKVSGLSVAFGGSLVVNNVDLEVKPGEIVGLVGPNGAGKTTAIDAITGFVVTKSGIVMLDDRHLESLPPSSRVNLGITRSFQSLELFDDLTVLDNLAIATDSPKLRHYVTGLVKPRPINISETAKTVIREFGLESVLDRQPGELSYGTRRLVAIARAIAAGPSILLLDEPAAGLDDHERGELSRLILRLARDWGMGILLVEHDVPMVMQVCDRIYVLEIGQVIASGTPAEIRNNSKVIEAFLGSKVDTNEGVSTQ